MVNFISLAPIVKEGEDHCDWNLMRRGFSLYSLVFLKLLGITLLHPSSQNTLIENGNCKFGSGIYLQKLKSSYGGHWKGFYLRWSIFKFTILCDLCGIAWVTTLNSLFFSAQVQMNFGKIVFIGSFWKIKGTSCSLILGVMLRDVWCSWSMNYVLWVVTMWYVWFYICQKKLSSTYRGMSDFSRGVLDSFHVARLVFPSWMEIGVKKGVRKWFSMKIERFQLDVDVSYNTFTNSFGVGVLVQDSNGKVCAA